MKNNKTTLHLKKIDCMLYSGFISTLKKHSDKSVKMFKISSKVIEYGITLTNYRDESGNFWASHYYPDLKRRVVYPTKEGY